MKRILRVALPLALVIGGLSCAGFMIAMSGSAEKNEADAAVTPVEVFEAHAERVPTRVDATGTVAPEQQIVLSPEVAGAIVEVAPNLMPGGRFAKGETLARIDSRDYSIAVAAEERGVRQAELELELEQGRQRTAAREWEVLGDGRPAADAPLAVRTPHLEVAKVGLEAARGSLTRAQLNLGRTRLKAPFDAVVVSESVDVGQYVGPGTQVATLVGTDALRVTVSVPVDRLGLLDLPADGRRGASAKVIQDLGGGRQVVRQGELVSLSGQLDPQTRTAQLLVRIEQPFRGDGLPLLPGAYVSVELEGRPVEGAYAVPRVAVYDGQTVWLADAENRMEKRTVSVLWADERLAVVTEGLNPGDRVITTPLSLPIAGSPVDVQRTVAALDGPEKR